MKTILLLSICLIGYFSHSQTAIIAHKSHSGTEMDFFTDPSTNFGEPGPQLIQIVRLNDSTCVHVYSEFSSGFIYHDTVRERTRYELNIDSVKETQNNRVEYVNFKHSPKSAKAKKPGNLIQLQEQPAELQQETPAKKKKRNALPFIFFVTAGGLLVFRFFNRMLTPQTLS
mgnify:CR=1 FL=1